MNEIWNIISAIAASATAFIVLCTAIFAGVQLWEIRKSRNLDTSLTLYNILQKESVRTARRTLLVNIGQNETKRNDFSQWTESETKDAEIACHTYNAAGVLTKLKLVSDDHIIQHWLYSIIDCWEVAQPMIQYYKNVRGVDYWSDFESLYLKAKKLKEGKS